MNLILHVAKVCKDYRRKNNITIKEFCEMTGNNNKTISAFEHGRANNIKYLFDYYKIIKDDDFIKELFNF